jgi:hypothetical protein
MCNEIKLFSTKGWISPYYIPRMILLDYVKPCYVSLGSYVQVHNEPDPKIAQHPRTLDCLYIHYADNKQGGHILLDLRTGRIIKRRKLSVVPITSNVIELFHQMATNYDMKDGLKIQTKSVIMLYDSSWIAGEGYVMITMMTMMMSTIQLAPTSMKITMIKIMMSWIQMKRQKFYQKQLMMLVWNN